jgi:YD repeat-containing protein
MLLEANPLGISRTMCYNAFNVPVSGRDSNGIVTEMTYNDAGLILCAHN